MLGDVNLTITKEQFQEAGNWLQNHKHLTQTTLPANGHWEFHKLVFKWWCCFVCECGDWTEIKGDPS